MNNYIVTQQPQTSGLKADITSGLSLPSYDHVDITYPTTATEHYVFKKSGTQVAILDLTYSDATKTDLTTIQKS